jgi:protein-S-isoprenylcysteine O-methyltransferase Ste14
MLRTMTLLYGVACHALFLVVYGCMAAFVGNFGSGLIPAIDGPPRGSLATSIAIDALLIGAFALQHSVMARPAFKEWWTRFVPTPVERSTYVLVSNLLMILLMWQWRPLGGVVWDVTHPVGQGVLYGLFALGWLMVPAVSLLIDHFDLFGSRQVWLHFQNRDYVPHSFRMPGAYRHVRHPLYVGWLVAFWATPTMTVSHLVFAGLLTAYILVAIPLEERDLRKTFGEAYDRYKKTVGALVPRLWAAPRLDLSALSSVTWWSWTAMIALLALSVFGHQPQAAFGAIGLCAAFAAFDLWSARGDLGAMHVQIRLGYLLLLIAGLLPGMQWLHAVQIAGAAVRNLTGYCLLDRELRLLPWNRVDPLTLRGAWRVLTARPGAGGLFRFEGEGALSAGCELRRRSVRAA